jgi:hypothetical protein
VFLFDSTGNKQLAHGTGHDDGEHSTRIHLKRG